MTSAVQEVDPRVVRWMSRRGQGLRLSAAAALLLAPRLRARWWAGIGAAVVMAAVLVWWWPTVGQPQGSGQRVSSLDTVRLAAPYIALALVLAGFTAIGRRRDRHLAAALPVRITRTGAVGLRTVLGTPLCLAVVVAAAVDAAILVLVARTGSTTLAVSYALGVLAVGTAVAVALGVIVRRPTVALDDSSLWIDERLRARDATAALTSWFYVDLGVLPHLQTGAARLPGTATLLCLLPLFALAAATLAGPGWRR